MLGDRSAVLDCATFADPSTGSGCCIGSPLSSRAELCRSMSKGAVYEVMGNGLVLGFVEVPVLSFVEVRDVINIKQRKRGGGVL